jgi:hypothetical protein
LRPGLLDSKWMRSSGCVSLDALAGRKPTLVLTSDVHAEKVTNMLDRIDDSSYARLSQPISI